jgi:hypothetical protein
VEDRREMPRKIRDTYTVTFTVFTSYFSYVLYLSTLNVNTQRTQNPPVLSTVAVQLPLPAP